MKLLYRRLFKGVTCAHWPGRRCDRAGRTSWRSRQAWHANRPARRLLTAARSLGRKPADLGDVASGRVPLPPAQGWSPATRAAARLVNRHGAELRTWLDGGQ